MGGNENIKLALNQYYNTSHNTSHVLKEILPSFLRESEDDR